MSVVIDTLLRVADAEFLRFAELERYQGDPEHVEGAVVIGVDGTAVLTRNEWDDLDPLWVYLVHAVEDCRNTGAGECYFPDQPLVFRAEQLPTGRLLVTTTVGATRRGAAANADEFYRAFATAGIEFFRHRDRVIRGGGIHQREADLCSRWLASAGG